MLTTLLCRLGLHRWSKTQRLELIFVSEYVEKSRCLRCGAERERYCEGIDIVSEDIRPRSG